MRFVTLALIAAVVGCTDDPVLDEPAGTVAFPDPMVTVTVDESDLTDEYLGIFGDRPFRGRGSYDMVQPSGEGEITLRLFRTVSEPDYSIDLTIMQDAETSLIGTRYLEMIQTLTDKDDFRGVRVFLNTPEGRRYRGGTLYQNQVQFDALTGSFRAQMRLRFDQLGDRFTFGVTIEGYLRVYCRHYDIRVAQLRPNWVDPYEPEDCTELFDSIRATPDDPEAPAPPYVLYE